ncbi:MAG: hypothetical protein HY075_13960 [Deltaproteobacteria bacterium]|nr:hypothetical protein [Deltaproteobacteria bacterium]
MNTLDVVLHTVLVLLLATLVSLQANAKEHELCGPRAARFNGDQLMRMKMAAKLFAARLTPKHQRDIQAFRENRMSNAQLATELERDVIMPTIEDLSALPATGWTIERYTMAIISTDDKDRNAVFISCLNGIECIVFDLAKETDYRAAIDRESARLGATPPVGAPQPCLADDEAGLKNAGTSAPGQPSIRVSTPGKTTIGN